MGDYIEISPMYLILASVIFLAVIAGLIFFLDKEPTLPSCPSCPACSPSLNCYGGNITINVTCESGGVVILNSTMNNPPQATGNVYYVSVSEGMGVVAQ
jgi:hypothetical protein